MIEVRVHRWFLALFIYAILILILMAIRPSFMFDKNGNLKQWRLETTENSSIFGAQVFIPLLALFSYYFAIFLDATFNL